MASRRPRGGYEAEKTRTICEAAHKVGLYQGKRGNCPEERGCGVGLGLYPGGQGRLSGDLVTVEKRHEEHTGRGQS